MPRDRVGFADKLTSTSLPLLLDCCQSGISSDGWIYFQRTCKDNSCSWAQTGYSWYTYFK